MQPHSTLLDAFLNRLEQKQFAFTRHSNQSTALCAEYNLRKRNPKRKLNRQFLRALRKGLGGAFSMNVKRVPSILFPINLGNMHWGYIINAQSVTKNSGSEVFGDGLGWKAPGEGFSSLGRNILNSSFRNCSGGSAKRPTPWKFSNSRNKRIVLFAGSIFWLQLAR